MGRVVIEVGDYRWAVQCRDGEEAQMAKLGGMIAERWSDAQRAAGEAGTFRVMLMAALMLADDLVDAQAKVASDRDTAPPPEPIDSDLLESLADRLEAVADALEDPAVNA